MLLADPYARKKSSAPSKNRVWNFFGTSAHFTGDLSSKTQCSQWEKPESVTTTASEHSYFALYEAYGTRPYEWGEDPDRQKANTKEEETDLGLLNEGMRYRDLDTGTFLTRDPISYADGPNIYCYVNCNPVTEFDPIGLTPIPWVNNLLNRAADSLGNSRFASGKHALATAMVETGIRGAAYSGSFTQAKDTYNASVDRTTTIIENQLEAGSNWGEAVAGAAIVVLGDMVGVTPATEAATGVDVETFETLSTGERVRRGVQGTSQMILTTAVAAKGYNNNLQSGKLNTPKPSSPGAPLESSSAPQTPGGRTLTDHAVERMDNPPRGRAPMSVTEVDDVLNTADKIKKVSPHPKGDTITVQNTQMPGKPQVVVDAKTGNNVVTVIKNEPKIVETP